MKSVLSRVPYRCIPGGLAVMALSFAVSAAPPNVRHVAAGAPAGGDGLSWATAYNDLQAAIAAAFTSGGAINELWIKQGTYLPGPAGSSDHTFTFLIREGLGVYGGFAGTESSRDQRDPVANITTLNGDLGGGAGHRVYRVVTMNGTGLVLDGVVVRGGNCLTTSSGMGAGVYIVAGSATLTGCTITGNTGFGNTAFPARGGGVYCGAGTAVHLIECAITNNSANDPTHFGFGRGGGLAAESSTVLLERCTISGNIGSEGGYSGCMGGQPGEHVTGGEGGGLYALASMLVLDRCVILNNRSGNGGMAPTCGFSTPNSGPGTDGGSGGGLYATDSSVFIQQCVLAGNAAGRGGSAGLVGTHRGGDGGSGGGVRVMGTTSAVAIINSTFADNEYGVGGPGAPSGLSGSGSAVSSAAGMVGTNSVFWDNGQGELMGSGTRTVTYCDVRGGHAGVGNINVDPGFIGSGDYRLGDVSPCIDAANNNADADPFTVGAQPLPTMDLDGLARFVDDPARPDTGAGTAPIVDMGPYEHQNAACAADLNGDGLVDFGDYLEFLNLYDAGDLRADFNGDGIVDFSDYLEFLNHYDAGC